MNTTATVTLVSKSPILPVLLSISACHLINDLMQALLPSLYPTLKTGLGLAFGQIGLLTMFYQLTASLLQPVVGMVTDRKPLPWLLPLGMILTCSGIYFLATSHSFHSLVFGAMILGAGSSVFHPEASRIVRATSRGSHGLAQSIFQTGGSLGSFLGPVVAVFLIAQGENPFMKVFSIGVVGVVICFA